jgi:small subunit ribosomal protein S17
MAEEEKNETTEDQPEETPEETPEAEAEETPAEEEAPAAEVAEEPAAEEAEEPAAEVAEEPVAEKAEEPAAEEAEEAPDDLSELDWKTRLRVERSREPHEAGPERSGDKRQADRLERRRASATARRRYRAAKRAKKGEPGTPTSPAERRPNPAKVRQGVVVSNKSDKTITVRIDIARRHSAYEKVVRTSRTLHAHDERNEAGQGDIVRVIETRPLSRLKRWRLVEVVEKAR